jgi:hypothetical protein
MGLRDDCDISDILSSINVEYIPPQFINGAQIEKINGDIVVISKEELEKIMESTLSLEEQGIVKIGMRLDFNIIKTTLLWLSDEMLSSIPE